MPPSEPATDRKALAFVSAVWLAMVMIAFWALGQATQNVPQTEDWLLVPGLTGNDPHFWQSLWAQNNEHRVPFPRLILTAVLRLAGGNFRAGMALNVVTLAAAAALLIAAVRKARQGRTIASDAIFPIALLHLGNWENLFWAWQATQVIPTVLVIVLICVGLVQPSLSAWRPAVAAGTATILLPLCGANGLFFVPFAAGWLLWAAFRQPAGIRVVLVSCAGLAGALSVAYFVGYQRPGWLPPNPGIGPSIAAAGQFVALGWGPAARSAWILMGAAGLALIAAGAAVGLSQFRRLDEADRPRAGVLLWWLAALGCFALAMGWGRAGAIAAYQLWPSRYSLFSAPALLVSCCLWTLGAPVAIRSLVPNIGLALMAILLPLNAVHGTWWNGFYQQGATAVLADLQAHRSSREIVQRHGEFLHHSLDPLELANDMRMLAAAGLWPWPLMADDPGGRRDSDDRVPRELSSVGFRYSNSGADSVELVWGVNGWWPVPVRLRPEGTRIEKGVMRTPMDRVNGAFTLTARIAKGGSLEYGFATVAPAVGSAGWEGDFSIRTDSSTTAAHSATRIASRPDSVGLAAVVPATVRYRAPNASAVVLVWGVNGWGAVAEALRGGETVIVDRVMQTRMRREGDVFVASIQAPAGAKLDYGFRSTERRGILDFVSPPWDPFENHPTISAGAVVEATSAVQVRDEFEEARQGWRYVAASLGLVGLAWAACFGVLGRLRSASDSATRDLG